MKGKIKNIEHSIQFIICYLFDWFTSDKISCVYLKIFRRPQTVNWIQFRKDNNSNKKKKQDQQTLKRSRYLQNDEQQQKKKMKKPLKLNGIEILLHRAETHTYRISLNANETNLYFVCDCAHTVLWLNESE